MTSAWPILASAALKSTVVLGAAWVVAGLLRGRSAAARHVVWTACAAALLALPVLSVVLPGMRLPGVNGILPAEADAVVFRTTATTPASGTATGVGAPAMRQASRAAAPAPASMNWRTSLLLLWAAGFAIGLLQMAVAGALLWRTRRAARRPVYATEADRLARELGIDEYVRVLETDSGMPLTFGVLRPTVLLPACAAEWSDERRRIVLLHELAHIRRGDAATHLMARTALALNWWNPLAWSAWRAFLRERERAADDLVLAAGAGAAEYASHLLEIARSMQISPAAEAAAIPMARPSQLEGRLLAILDRRVRRTQLSRWTPALTVLLAIAMMAPLAVVRAQSKSEATALQDVDATIAGATAQKNREILDQAAVSYEQLRKFAEAKKLREASLALAEQVNGAQSAEYAAALARLGDLARRYGTPEEANAYYQRALALGDRPEVFGVLMRMALTSKDPDKRREYLERARVVGKNAGEIGTATTWLAHDRENDPADPTYSDSLYRAAIAMESPGSPELALSLEMYSQMLRNKGREAEADAAKDRAVAIRKTLVASAVQSRMIMDQAPVKVGNGVTPPQLLRKMEPEYSDEARSAKFQGTVLLKVVIDTDGTAKNIELVRGLGYGLDEKAALAIGQWVFKPGTNGGVPVPVQAQIEVNFRLL
jgi:TonB family protein